MFITSLKTYAVPSPPMSDLEVKVMDLENKIFVKSFWLKFLEVYIF